MQRIHNRPKAFGAMQLSDCNYIKAAHFDYQLANDAEQICFTAVSHVCCLTLHIHTSVYVYVHIYTNLFLWLERNAYRFIFSIP